tara:strand:- start:23414 stop:23545 length:132 start_codon:yes stop_codon:yes gene_type:complete
MKPSGMGTAGNDRILKEIRDILLRIEEHLLKDNKKVKKKLLKD